MNIRNKLTLQFIFIVTIIFIFSSSAIYYFSSRYRKKDFYDRMLNNATISARILIEIEEVNAATLAKIEKNNPVNLPMEKIKIYNYRNAILYSSDKENTLEITPALLDEIRLKDQVRLKQGDLEILGFLFKEKYDRFVVIIGANDIYGWKKMNNLRKVLFFVFIISLIITFLLGWIYAGRALRPIAKVIDQVNEISIKSLHLRVDEGKGHDEISKLALTFNKMLTRLENSFTIQENFIANASHEIRTPLTAMSGQLEVVLLNERNPDTYKSVILSVLEEINNMADISNRLLLLARASSEKPATNFKPVRIDEVIWQSKTDLQKRFPGYQINISVSPEIDDENKLIVEGSEQLLNIVIINLMDNGCKFSSDHTVNVTIDHHDQHIQIEFRDHGIGIPEEDQLHILEPFHRGRNAINMKGHGIGLSLVDMLTRHHHGNLSFSSVLNEGSCFCLKFPTKSGT